MYLSFCLSWFPLLTNKSITRCFFIAKQDAFITNVDAVTVFFCLCGKKTDECEICRSYKTCRQPC